MVEKSSTGPQEGILPREASHGLRMNGAKPHFRARKETRIIVEFIWDGFFITIKKQIPHISSFKVLELSSFSFIQQSVLRIRKEGKP